MTDFPNQQNQMLYVERKEWKDIKPIYNTTNEDCAVKISTSEECMFSYISSF